MVAVMTKGGKAEAFVAGEMKAGPVPARETDPRVRIMCQAVAWPVVGPTLEAGFRLRAGVSTLALTAGTA